MLQYHLNLEVMVPERCEDLTCSKEPHFTTRAEAFAALEVLDEEVEPTGLPAVTALDDRFEATPHSILLPVGRYWFGDPCYLVEQSLITLEIWNAFVNLTATMSREFTEPLSGALIFNAPLITVATAFGDGVYDVNDGRLLNVDSGCIGATSSALIPNPWLLELMEVSGFWVDLKVATALTQADGLITLGEIQVATS